jgi:hypothetical protein
MGCFRRVLPPAIVALSLVAAQRLAAATCGFRRTAVPAPSGPEGPTLLWSWDADSGQIADWDDADPGWEVNVVAPIYGSADIVPASGVFVYLTKMFAASAPASGITALTFRVRLDATVSAGYVGVAELDSASGDGAIVSVEFAARVEDTPALVLKLHSPDTVSTFISAHIPIAFDTTYHATLIHDASGDDPVGRLLLNGEEVASLTDDSGTAAGLTWFPATVYVDGMSARPTHWQTFAIYDGIPAYVPPPPPPILFADPFADGDLAGRGWSITTFAPATVEVVGGVLHLATANQIVMYHDLDEPGSGITSAVLSALTFATDGRQPGNWLGLGPATIDLTDAATVTLELNYARDASTAPGGAGQGDDTFDPALLPEGTPVDVTLVIDVSGAQPVARVLIGGVEVASVTDPTTGAYNGVVATYGNRLSFRLSPNDVAQEFTVADVTVYDGPAPLWSDSFVAGNLAPLTTTSGSDPDGDASVQAGVGLTLTAPPTIGNYTEVAYQFRPSGGTGAVTALVVGYTLAHASDALSVFLTNDDFTADAYYQTSGGAYFAGIETAGDYGDGGFAGATDTAPHTVALIVDDTGADPVLTVKFDGVTVSTATLAIDPIGDLTVIRLRSTRGGGPGPFAPLIRSVVVYDADPGV